MDPSFPSHLRRRALDAPRNEEVLPRGAGTFKAQRRAHSIAVAAAHHSYLINLASPDPALWERSVRSFRGELLRSVSLGLDLVVTHPGNATDGDYASGLVRNDEGLERVEGPTAILLELTAGSGTSLGSTFERLAAILAGIPRALGSRVGVCVDTGHAFAAGYDLARQWDGVWSRFDDAIGLDRLRLLHVNDSRRPLGSRVDRHEHLGKGAPGVDPCRRRVNYSRIRAGVRAGIGEPS